MLKVAFVRSVARLLPDAVPDDRGLAVARISGFEVRIVLENRPVVEVEATVDANEEARRRFAYARARQLPSVPNLQAWAGKSVFRSNYPGHFTWTRGNGKTQIEARAWTVRRVGMLTSLIRRALLTKGSTRIVIPQGWPPRTVSPPPALTPAGSKVSSAAARNLPAPEKLINRESASVPAPEVSSNDGVRPVPGLLCPVCDKGGLPAGRSRHLRCERASRALLEPVAITPGVRREEYRRLVATVEQREESTRGRRDAGSTRPVRIAAAREAVVLRCAGRCENPSCPGQPDDVTDAGAAILQVDHVNDLAMGGRDHPSQMVALCPNCHAIKTLGRTREALRSILTQVAATAHRDWTSTASPMPDCEPE